MNDFNIHQQVDLLRLHVLREFLRLHNVDIDGLGFEIGSLLDRIMDRDIDAVSSVKAIRNFGRLNHTLKVDEHLPPLVLEAVVKGLEAAGVSWTKEHCTFTLNLTGANHTVGLLEAKKLFDLLRSM
jgi:hypothetical protein